MKATKTNYLIANTGHIPLRLIQSKCTITDSTGKQHPGDDRILLFVADADKYDTDLMPGGNLTLRFTPAQARSLARLLWQMAPKCRLAEDYKDASDIPGGPVIPNELLKDLK